MSMPAQVETYFDPDDGLEERVAREIGLAKESVWIQAYKFSSEAMVDTILQLKRVNPALDVRLALEAAREAKQPLPITTYIERQFGLAEQRGHGREDLSAIVHALLEKVD